MATLEQTPETQGTLGERYGRTYQEVARMFDQALEPYRLLGIPEEVFEAWGVAVVYSTSAATDFPRADEIQLRRYEKGAKFEIDYKDGRDHLQDSHIPLFRDTPPTEGEGIPNSGAQKVEEQLATARVLLDRINGQGEDYPNRAPLIHHIGLFIPEPK